MTFGEKLYRLRKERGMSQEALAQELGVSRQAISRWELEEVAPDTGNVLAASRLFGVSTDYLLRDECGQEADTPAVRRAERSLQERQAAVGKGVLCRVLWLTLFALFHQYRLEQLSHSFRRRSADLSERMEEADDERIIRMRQSQLDKLKADFEARKEALDNIVKKVDLDASLQVKGILHVY